LANQPFTLIEIAGDPGAADWFSAGTQSSVLAFSLRIPLAQGGRRHPEGKTMWLSFFTIATAASIGLSVAAIMVQTANQNESLDN